VVQERQRQNQKAERANIRQCLTLFVLLWLSGACARLTVLAIPPVVPLLHADLHLSETGIGWLASLPPMLFAIAAVPGALIIARFGMVPALLVGLLLTAAGSAARGVIADAVFLFASTIVMGAGVAVVQTVMPPLVRSWFPQRIGLATTIYTNGLLIGESSPLVLPSRSSCRSCTTAGGWILSSGRCRFWPRRCSLCSVRQVPVQ
jgi:CP family cyanate transporter-like MFS transporter